MPYVATKNSSAAIAALRYQRDALLKTTDWAVMPDSPLTEEEREATSAYRTALRDCTKPDVGQKACLPSHEGLPSKVIGGVLKTLALLEKYPNPN